MFFIVRVVVFICFAVVSNLAWAEGLDAYLATLGPATEVSLREGTTQNPGRVAFQSQVWRTIPWRHELIIKTPQRLSRSDIVVITLTGGQGGESHQNSAQALADALGVRSVVLTRVPNQPLYGGKTEDVLLSYTLNEYRRSGDASWPLLFPMVSSVVKGIDVLQDVLGEPQLKVVLIGASKRGWTTYLSAAVDRRIIGMIPAVFEMVSMERQIALARSRYGRDSEKIRPYTALGLTDALLEPRVAQLVRWLDPVSYTSRYTVPKLVVLGSNDPYWVVDSVRTYWHALPDPKVLRVFPNEGHGVLSNVHAQEAIVTFIRDLLGSHDIPRASWNFSASALGRAIISGGSVQRLEQCRLWRAISKTSDFRTAIFEQRACHVSEDGRRFTAPVTTCDNRNTAAFVDLVIAADRNQPRRELSTESHVWLVAGSKAGGSGDVPNIDCL